jgi:hypothetical protein
VIVQPSPVWRDLAAILAAQSLRLTREAAPVATKSGPRQISKPKAAEQEASGNVTRST